MSKFARIPIPLGLVEIAVIGNQISYKGPKASGIYILPVEIEAIKEENNLILRIADNVKKKTNFFAQWGLHRALLANAIKGSEVLFERQIKIDGLGFKAQLSGKIITFSLGFSHKITYNLPEEVILEVDKSGQLLTFKSTKKDLLGHVCSCIKAFRPVEPYKGKGIHYVGETIIRKAGKTSGK